MAPGGGGPWRRGPSCLCLPSVGAQEGRSREGDGKRPPRASHPVVLPSPDGAEGWEGCWGSDGV